MILSTNKIIFLLKDPYWTLIWWKLSPQMIQEVENYCGKNITDIKSILRIHDITGIHFDGNNSHYYFDIEADGYIDHYYLNIWASNRTYCVEIGFMEESDIFHPISKSNPLALPRDCPSSINDGPWSSISI